MASTDARPIPRKNTAYRHYFAIRKSDGTLITTWAGQDSKVAVDGASFADATSEATEIDTSGCGYIDLTAGEMNGDAVVLKVTVTNTGALPYIVTFFPEESGDLRSNITQILGSPLVESDDGQVALGLSAFFDVETPTKDMNDISNIVIDEDDLAQLSVGLLDQPAGGSGKIKLDISGNVFTVNNNNEMYKG
ncbi:MAG TPA: hypothetical protein PLP05_06125 [Sedimentisphaerales bacterium]|nr:hypothetical protein [Sedimentisphaerales bacterium]